MLQTTTEALDRLIAKLSGRRAAEDEVMRFIRRPHGWSLRVDRARPTDVTLTHRGRTVLAMDGAVAERMSNMRLDIRMTDSGPRLTLR